MKKIFGIVLLIINTIALQAQDNNEGRIPKRDKSSEKRERMNALLKLEEEGEPAFKKQSVFGIKLATDGYGISWEKGKYLSPRKTRLYQFELNEKKHTKEGKFATSQNPFTGQINSVIIGKQNNFYQFKMGMGEQYLLGGKANKSGVAVSFVYAGGISIGLAKPYLVNVVDSTNTNDVRRVTWDTILADPANNYIIGASGFTYGWDKLKIKPGLHAKGAMRFDYGRFHETVSAIEAGLNFEYYFQKIPQMAYSTPKNFFFNAYITILFGRRR